MGKVRVMTIGDENAEKEQKEELKKRKEAKKFEKKVEGANGSEDPEGTKGDRRTPLNSESVVTSNEQNAKASSSEETLPDEKKKTKKEKFLKKKASPRSTKYTAVAEHVDKKKAYSLKEALALLPKLKTAKFDETVELHINTIETGVSGSIVLPHGNGKKTRVTIVDATKDPKGLDELIKNIEAGIIEFDVLVATPDSMSRLAKVARYLGPKGLMPNPKSGTVTTKPEEVAKKYEGGQINFKTEAKFPILHMSVGKMSFDESKLSENIKTALKAIQISKMKSVTLKSTMSPGIKIDFSAI